VGKMAEKPVVIIGAGIVGISAAIWLRRMGKPVTVVDRGAVGMGASYGNGGVLAACGVVPVTGPGLALKAPRMLFGRNYPLFLRWGYLPKLTPWLFKFMRHANDADTRRIAKGLAAVIGDSVEQHEALSRGSVAAPWLSQSDYTFAYKNRAAFEADSYSFGLRKQAGFTPELIEGPEVQEYEPALGPDTTLLAVMKNHGYIRSPIAYIQALAEVLKAEGGEIRRAEVRDIELKDGRAVAVLTDQGPIACESVVLAAGAWSKPMAKKLGLTVPLETERGYHIVFKNPSFTLRNPLMIAEGKFVVTPMEGGLRCAGIVELGGLEAGPSKAPLAFIYRKVRESFPALEYAGTEEWMGHRPTLSDSLPVIGEIGKTGVFAGFGHHHVGLTGGPKTGRILAEMITGRVSNTDYAAFDPQRFA